MISHGTGHEVLEVQVEFLPNKNAVFNTRTLYDKLVNTFQLMI